MKTTKHFITAILFLLVAFCYGQDYAYVTANSGLTIREQPDVNALKIGKLQYNGFRCTNDQRPACSKKP